MTLCAIIRHTGQLQTVLFTAVITAVCCIFPPAADAQLTISPRRVQFPETGSTIPIKLHLLNEANANVSSAGVNVKSRKVIRLQDRTAVSVFDSGNSNPDSDFLYDATIGGTGGYIYDLNTKDLTIGRCSLSMYVGSEKQYLCRVSFD